MIVQGERYKRDEESPLDWMMKRGITTWCKHYFEKTSMCDFSLNNHCESFNRMILEARDMPILSCLETIRYQMMKR
ncbi:hypothetical protein LINGRAHAP2_LOCUS526, partial [Linum grandiflorum]